MRVPGGAIIINEILNKVEAKRVRVEMGDRRLKARNSRNPMVFPN